MVSILLTFIAIASDPENDTLVAVRNFAVAHHLEGKWHYLLGTRPQLEPVWNAYFVAAQKLRYILMLKGLHDGCR